MVLANRTYNPTPEAFRWFVDQSKLLGIDSPGLEVPFGHTTQCRFPIIPCSYHSFVSPIPIGQLVEESDYVRKLSFDQVHTRGSRWLMKILHGVVVKLVNHLIHSENLLLWGSRFFIPYDKRPEIPAHPTFTKLFPLICFSILAPRQVPGTFRTPEILFFS